MRHSIAPNHESSEIKGFIGTFEFDRSEIDKVSRKSVYNLNLSEDKSCHDCSFLIARLKVDQDEKCLRLYKEDSEAMIFHNELPGFLLEYSPNKLLIGSFIDMYLVLDWNTVILIEETNPSNSFKYYNFTVPDFNEESNPFIVVLGMASLNILNVKTCQHKPLINQKMVVGFAGLQGAFIKKEKNGLSLHFANIVQDTDGSGSDLLQYSYVEIKNDLLHWLREAGRLPSASMKEYFSEIVELN